MREEYRHIFTEIFERNSKPPVAGSEEYTYTNSSQSRPFSVAGVEYTENTFVCLKYKLGIRTGKCLFFTYYVSDYDYNLNEVPGGSKIEGRFVFFDGKIHGLAEINGTYHTEVEGLSLEEYYLKNRPHHPAGKFLRTQSNIAVHDLLYVVTICSE